MLSKFLNFNEMVTPLIIKIIYWIGIAGCVLSGLGVIVTGMVTGNPGTAFISGLLIIVLGPLCVRVYCELLIVLFEIHKNLVEINKKTQ